MSFDKIPATIDVQDLERRISELEKTTEYLNSSRELLKDKIYKDIAELRVGLEVMEDHKPLIYGKLNELKERVDFLLDSELQAKETDYTITEVLRELIRDMPNLLEWIINNFQHVPDFNKEAGNKWQYHFLHEMREKLDGVGSARQTEECEWSTTEYCMKPEEVSGGVDRPKLLKVNEGVIDPDSKPAEPNTMLDDLKEDPAFRLGREYERKQNEPRENLYFCRLCGNEITDVEHEVSKLTVEVKREDLQKLSDWINRFPVDWNEFMRIKEEYNLE